MDEKERGELDSFEEILDDSAAIIAAHYEEAEEERQNSDNLDYQTEKVMVSFPYGTSEETIEKIVQECAVDYEVIDSGKLEIDENLPDYKKKRLEKIKDYKTDVVILATLGLEDTVARAEEKFEEYGCVVDATENTFLEADGIVQTSSGKITTNDPKFNDDKQWNLKTIDLPRAYRKFHNVTFRSEIWVAVIDCGVQMNHPDLKDNMQTIWSADITQGEKELIKCKDEKSPTGQYTSGHGTMVAGIIAAKANNGRFGAGITSAASWDCDSELFKIVAIKCDNTLDFDRHITKAYLAKAINYATRSSAEVINISYSAMKAEYSEEHFKAVENAIKRAIAADVCVVASAGNDGGSTSRYPAAFPGVIGVGATMPDNTMASFSNRSPAVDILAPVGTKDTKRIFCLYPTTTMQYGCGDGGGTSCAAPQVAATAALMKSLNYNLTPAQILSRMKNNSTVAVKVNVNGTVKTIPLLNTGKAVESAK